MAGVGVGVGIGVAVGCRATVAVGFGVCEGFCSHLWHGGWDCSSHGRSDGRCRRGLQRPALAYNKNDCSNSESGQHNQGAAQIRQTRTLPVFGLANGQRHQHYTIRYLANLRRVEPRTSVVMPKHKDEGFSPRTIPPHTNGVVRLCGGFQSIACEYLSFSCLLCTANVLAGGPIWEFVSALH